jgi:hypothetical protein
MLKPRLTRIFDSVNPAAPTDNRQSKRQDCAFQAAAVIDGERIDCSIIDISTGGAKIAVRLSVERGAELALSLDKIGDLSAQVAWKSGGNVASGSPMIRSEWPVRLWPWPPSAPAEPAKSRKPS